MKVWLSRYDTEESKAKIEALGGICIVAPLLQLQQHPCKIASGYDAIIITSSNAIAAIPQSATVITAGEKSANILRAAGIKVKASFRGVEDLIISVSSWPKAKLLYLRGEHVTANLKESLGCTEEIVYTMQARLLSNAEAEAIKHADCIMVYSARSGKLLSEAMAKYGLNPSAISAICISEKAATAVRHLPLKQVLIAQDPSEDSMMLQLKAIMGKSASTRKPRKDTIHIICGPTASGKSRYALDLALQNNGHIINADSMQIYKNLEIITAQPSKSDRALVPHHLYGHIACGTYYSVGTWLQEVDVLIKQILAQGKTPIVVGGTGMYINALVGGIATIPDISPEIKNMVREMLHNQPVEHLHQSLMLCDPILAARLASTDSQRITRGLEVYHQTGVPLSQWQNETTPLYPYDQFHITLINPPREQLYANINQRFLTMLDNGLLEEVKFIMSAQQHSNSPLPKALGLHEMISYLMGEKSMDEAISLSQQLTRNYAKRQITWFKNQLSYDVVLDGP